MFGIQFQIDDSKFRKVLTETVVRVPVEILAATEDGARRLNQAIRDNEPHGSGELQALTGEFDPSLLETFAGEIDESKAVFWIGQTGPNTYGAIVGTNLEYAKFVNDGFVVGENQLAHFTEQGKKIFRRLTPGMEYPGVYMFEKGAQDAELDFRRIVSGRVTAAMTGARNAYISATKRGQVVTRSRRTGRFVSPSYARVRAQKGLA